MSEPKIGRGDPRFYDVLYRIAELHDRKQADYGSTEDPFANVRASEDFGIPGWVGSIVRGNDKMKRLQKAARGQTLANESIEDSLMDLAVYAIIGLVLFRELEQDAQTIYQAALDAGFSDAEAREEGWPQRPLWDDGDAQAS